VLNIPFRSIPRENIISCRATGQPIPRVEWQTTKLPWSGFNDFLPTPGNGIATVVRRYVGPSHTTIQCNTQNTPQDFKLQTVHLKHHSDHPRIDLFYESIFDFIGANITLPCHTHPPTPVFWLTPEHLQILSGNK
jgi:hypothetical protein